MDESRTSISSSTVATTVVSGEQSQTRSIKFNKNYLFQTTGMIHLSLTIMLLPVIISVSLASVPDTPRLPTEHALLFFSCSAFVIEIVQLLLFLLNIYQFDSLKRVPINSLICFKDILLMIPIVILSIFCIMHEAQRRRYTISNYKYGSFASSAVFGFVCTLLYTSHFVSLLYDIVKERKMRYQFS